MWFPFFKFFFSQPSRLNGKKKDCHAVKNEQLCCDRGTPPPPEHTDQRSQLLAASADRILFFWHAPLMEVRHYTCFCMTGCCTQGPNVSRFLLNIPIFGLCVPALSFNTADLNHQTLIVCAGCSFLRPYSLILLLFRYVFVIHIAMHLPLSSTGRLSRLSTGRSESKSSYSRNGHVPSSASSVSSRSIRSISPSGKPWKWILYNLHNLQSFPFNPWSTCLVELFLFILKQYC